MYSPLLCILNTIQCDIDYIPKLFFNYFSFNSHYIIKKNKKLSFKVEHLQKPVLGKFLKSFLKYKQPNFYTYFCLKKLSNTTINPIFFNKFKCFWPIMRSRNNLIKFLARLVKNQKKKNIKFLKSLHNNLRKLKKIKMYKYKFLSLFSKKNKKTTKRSHFFNFHRRQIKIFWKSQEFFKLNFLEKTRFTTRKFKNKFNYWYKKNYKKQQEIANRLSSFISQSFLFFSANHLNTLFNSSLICINNLECIDKHHIIKKNDIISLPLNYASHLSKIILGNFFSIKILKKKNYIYYKNKASQWKNIKKKQAKESFYNLYTQRRINSNIEFDIFSAKICLISDSQNIQKFANFTLRHNLEKLNTYKLNV